MNLRSVLSVALLGCMILNPECRADEIKLAIGGTPLQNLFIHIQKPYEEKTGTKLIFVGPAEGLSTEQIFKSVESGEAEGGCTATPWQDAPAVLKKNNVQIKDFDMYKYRVVGMDLVQVLLDKTNPAKELTNDQLKGLFTGTITNWKSINGKDMPVKLIMSDKNQAMNFIFQKKILDGDPFSKTAIINPSIQEARNLVGKTPGGIGLGAVGFINDSFAIPKHTEVGRPLNFFTKGPPSDRVQKFLSWLTTEGTKYQLRRPTN